MFWAFGEAASSAFNAGALQWSIAMLTEYQDILRGISIGIGFSLIVTYWPLLKLKIRRSFKWIGLFVGVAWKSRPGYRRLTWGGGIKLLSGVQSKIFDTVPFDVSTTRFEREDNPTRVYLEVISPGKIRASRRAQVGVDDVLIAKFELWGRPLFWASIRKAWKSDIVGLREWVAGWKETNGSKF